MLYFVFLHSVQLSVFQRFECFWKDQLLCGATCQARLPSAVGYDMRGALSGWLRKTVAAMQ
mgnify:CR=1 FL=1